MAVGEGDYFDELETMSPAAREKYQADNLSKTVEYACQNSVFARELLDKAGLSPSSIRCAKDLELLPVTRKNDLIELQKAHPPFGGLLGRPAEDIERIFISPGPVYEIQSSSIKWFARSFYAAGFRRGDIAVNTFTYHMSPAGMLFHEALRHCGATVVVMGTGNTDMLVRAMVDLKINAFVGTPTFLMTVLKRAEEMGYRIGEGLALKKTWFTGEMLPPSLRKVFEEDYNLSTSQAYAVTEPGGAIAYECQEKNGLHLMDEYIVEIVDPQTGRQLKPGEAGEIVVTPIHDRAWGLLRFGTGDISSLIIDDCPCGRTSFRLNGIMGRTGDAVKVRGMFVVAKQAEQVINGFEAVVKFRIVIDREDNRDRMDLKLELKSEADKGDIIDQINRKFQDACRVKLDTIQIVPPGAIPEPHKPLEDIRKWD
ncbi:MAG: AMP-binding protein [Dehalococcoidales bacterium]|nr:AMP-binding protein [Dehalococcoidales bacterium]